MPRPTKLQVLTVTVVVVLLTGLAALAAYGAQTARWLSWVAWPATFESIAQIAQVIGLAVAGWWTYQLFIRQRHDRTRANIEHYVSSAVVSPTERVVRVLLEMQNTGSVLLKPPGAWVRLDIVAPRDAACLEQVRTSGLPEAYHEDALSLA